MPTRTDWLLAAAPLTAAAIGVFAEGGYSPGPRIAFGVAALLAAAVVVAARRTVRIQPVVAVLLTLAALGALSALWTIGPVDRTLIWALVTAGFAGLALAASATTIIPIAAGIAAIATISAAIGLTAAVAHIHPEAEQIAAVWRPGGPFQYPPALAALQVAALPPLLSGMLHRHRMTAAAAALGLALAGGAIALSASRISLALALGVAGLALAYPRGPRGHVAAAIALAALAGIALALAPEPPVLIAVALIAPAAWLATRRREAVPSAPQPKIALAVLAIAVVAGSIAFGAAPNRGAGAEAGFLHGRTDTWEAAIETFADRPLYGTGADAFLAGSARHQDGQTIVFAHSLPLELAAELGIAGLILALALYAATARTIWRARDRWLLGPAAATLPITSLVDWQWHLAGAGAVWALAIGALASKGKEP
jgi:hypothetical protein